MRFKKSALVTVPIIAFMLMGADSSCGSSSEEGGSGGSGGDSGNHGDQVTLTEGQAADFGNWHVQPGWKLTKSFVGYGLNMQVKNTKDESDQAFFTVRLLNGKLVVADIQCSTGEIQPGQIIKANCIADGQQKKSYSKITVENSF